MYGMVVKMALQIPKWVGPKCYSGEKKEERSTLTYGRRYFFLSTRASCSMSLKVVVLVVVVIIVVNLVVLVVILCNK